MEEYIKLLKENDLKITPQRIMILDYLYKNRTHPTADEIYKALKSKNPSLSKTTVYNSLEALKNAGIIQEITISGKEMRYDLNKEMHHHFYCRKCGNIIDMLIECTNIEKMEKYGHKIEEIHGYVIGICKDCLRRTRK